MSGDVRAEAIEAARLALQDRTGRTRQSTQRDAETAVDAATPHLLAPIRALHHEADEPGNDYHMCICGDAWPCPTTKVLDAIESEATSEGGTRCVTVTRRYRDGEWEGDDLPTPDEALRMGWSV